MLLIKILNDGTGTTETGNYRYQVCINSTVIDSGGIKDFHRRDGWLELIRAVVKDCETKSFVRDCEILFEDD